MDQLAKAYKVHKSPSIQEQSQNEDELSPKRREIQIMDRVSNIASINQNMENTNISRVKLPQLHGQLTEDANTYSLPKVLFVSITLIQFSILLSLILIQYISSKIELSTLTGLIVLIIILHSLLLISGAHLQILARMQGQRNHTQNDQPVHPAKEGAQIPTVPKITQDFCKRSNAKTKKLQYPNITIPQPQKNTQLTIKKEPSEGASQIIEFPIQSLSFSIKKNLLIFFKITQVILSIVLTSISLCIFEAVNDQNHTAVIALSILLYILAFASGIIFSVFLKNIDIISQLNKSMKVKDIGIEAEIEEQQQPKTKISIDQLIPKKSIERKKIFSIDRVIKFGTNDVEGLQKQEENTVKSKSEVDKQGQKIFKSELKRSVLKSAKNRSKKPVQQDIDEQIMSRRKVEINSKKIQYFEYSVISPSHSVIDDQEANKNKLAKSSKYSGQKLAFMKQRMQNEMNLIKKKALARQSKAKSLSGPNQMKRQSENEDSFRVDYFF